jgi:hypothetical protein
MPTSTVDHSNAGMMPITTFAKADLNGWLNSLRARKACGLGPCEGQAPARYTYDLDLKAQLCDSAHPPATTRQVVLSQSGLASTNNGDYCGWSNLLFETSLRLLNFCAIVRYFLAKCPVCYTLWPANGKGQAI